MVLLPEHALFILQRDSVSPLEPVVALPAGLPSEVLLPPLPAIPSPVGGVPRLPEMIWIDATGNPARRHHLLAVSAVSVEGFVRELFCARAAALAGLVKLEDRSDVGPVPAPSHRARRDLVPEPVRQSWVTPGDLHQRPVATICCTRSDRNCAGVHATTLPVRFGWRDGYGMLTLSGNEDSCAGCGGSVWLRWR
jgi:hypothetical protein